MLKSLVAALAAVVLSTVGALAAPGAGLSRAGTALFDDSRAVSGVETVHYRRYRGRPYYVRRFYRPRYVAPVYYYRPRVVRYYAPRRYYRPVYSYGYYRPYRPLYSYGYYHPYRPAYYSYGYRRPVFALSFRF